MGQRTINSERLFFALVPPSGVVQSLWQTQSSLAIAGKAVPPENFHLTLAFLGHVPCNRIDPLISAADALRCYGFSLELDQLGHFPQAGIVYAGLSSPPQALVGLSKALRQASHRQQASPRVPRYVPHVTLFRGAEVVQPFHRLLEPPILWRIFSYHLMRSRPVPGGVRYESLAEFNLLPVRRTF
jgi:2'-5' RNA ligase